ncbi:MAG: EamA family transporter [Acidobacteria bacterium]|nr:EamA family transporter [Acidobacteriota bacterium]
MIQVALLAAVVLAGAAGDVSVTRAMKTVGEISDFHPTAIIKTGLRAARNGYLWLGIFWKTVAFFSFITLITHAELSWVVPATAISFVIETVAAKYLLRERITATRWAGALCICLGVALLSF